MNNYLLSQFYVACPKYLEFTTTYIHFKAALFNHKRKKANSKVGS